MGSRSLLSYRINARTELSFCSRPTLQFTDLAILYTTAILRFVRASVGDRAVHTLLAKYEKSISLPPHSQRVHACRAAGRHCDHRNPCRSLVAGDSSSAGSRSARRLPEHDPPMGRGDAELSCVAKPTAGTPPYKSEASMGRLHLALY